MRSRRQPRSAPPPSAAREAGLLERVASAVLIVGLVPVAVLFVVHSLPGGSSSAQPSAGMSELHQLAWHPEGPGQCRPATPSPVAPGIAGGRRDWTLVVDAGDYTRCAAAEAADEAWTNYRISADVGGVTPDASAVLTVRHTAAGRVEAVVGEGRLRIQQRTSAGWSLLDEWTLPRARSRHVDVRVRDDELTVVAAGEPARTVDIDAGLVEGPPSFAVAADGPARVRFARLAAVAEATGHADEPRLTMPIGLPTPRPSSEEPTP